MMQAFWPDLRYGARMLSRNPGVTVVTVLIVALGIGATTSIFSVVNGVLLTPLPYHEPDRLVMIWGTDTLHNEDQTLISLPDYTDWKQRTDIFEDTAVLFASPNSDVNLTGGREPERVPVARVSSGYFNLLGVKFAAGRGFTPEEDREGNHRVAILSYGLWQRRFGGDPDLVGQAVKVNSFPYTVVGILPPDFQPLSSLAMGLESGLWRPLAPNQGQQENRGWRWLRGVGRLRPGVSREAAQNQLRAVAATIETQYPESNEGRGINLVSLHEQVVRDSRSTVLILLAAVALVLLIACANVANLLLARTAAREKEFAVRAALGAGRVQLIRQLLTESMLLFALGGGLGLLLAYGGTEFLKAVSPGDIPRLEQVALDGWVLLFALGITLATSLVFGLLPAWQFSRPDLQASLKEGGRSGRTAASGRLRSALVVSEVALALVLLVGAGLLLRSFQSALAVDPGFKPEGVLTFQIELPMGKGTPYTGQPARTVFVHELVRRLEALPGAETVSFADSAPLDPDDNFAASFQLEGEAELPPDQRPRARVRLVGLNYFRTMGIPLMEGRVFSTADPIGRPEENAPRQIIINKAMAERHWPGQSPLGKRIRMFGDSEIVGVAGDVRLDSLEEAGKTTVYYYAPQVAYNFTTILIRTPRDPMSLSTAARKEVQAMDAEIPLHNVQPLAQLVSRAVAQRRFTGFLMGLFAAAALLLAAVGLYGVISYSVTQRIHEMGIRMALGAQSKNILSLVIGQGMALTMFGVVTGLVAAFVLTRFLENMLFGVTATDPLTYTGISALLLLTAAVASFLPARRATKVDPMVALRYE